MITTDLLSNIVKSAIDRGATDAEAIGIENTEFAVEVRLGEVEKLQEAASRGIGLRVLYEGRQASCSTSDISPKALEDLVVDAVEMARFTSVDEAAVLPDPSDLSRDLVELELYDQAISDLSTERKIDMARLSEEAARSVDQKISNSEGSACSSVISNTTYVTSSGFTGQFRSTMCGLMVAPIAKEGDQMQVGYWGDRQRKLSALDAPELIGRESARRALRKLGARKVSTREAPIVFESSVAEDLLGDFFDAVDGTSIFHRASFLVGKLGERIGAPELTIIDDGRLKAALGSRPFDGEGLATRRTVVVEHGVLKSYLLNTYTGKKLGLKSTGNASRGLSGAPGVGPSNFFISPGVYSPGDIVNSVKNGFYVTDLIGFGFNTVTGDYSRGAAGWWIENGELAFPVEEVTIAGNFRDMLLGIEMIGNDLRFRSRFASPTLKINKMMVSGD